MVCGGYEDDTDDGDQLIYTGASLFAISFYGYSYPHATDSLLKCGTILAECIGTHLHASGTVMQHVSRTETDVCLAKQCTWLHIQKCQLSRGFSTWLHLLYCSLVA